MTWALRFLCRPSAKGALTHHRPRPSVVLPDGSRAPTGAAPPGASFPAGICQQTPTAACASDVAVPITGGLEPSATNKRHRVYTCALLATTISTYK